MVAEQARPTPEAGGGRSWWGVVAAVGSPVEVATALLVYFGWARSSVQAARLGYDISIAEYTTLDYYAWFTGYRRLTIRYERIALHYTAFATLAAAITCYKKLAT